MSSDDSHFSRGEHNRRRKSKGTSKSVLEGIADDTQFCYGTGTPPSEEHSPVGARGSSPSSRERPTGGAFSSLPTKELNDIRTPPSGGHKTKHKRALEKRQNKANKRFSLQAPQVDPLDVARNLQSTNGQSSNSQERRSELERRQPQENNIQPYNGSYNGGTMISAKRKRHTQSLQNQTRKNSSPQKSIIYIDQEEEEEDHGRSTTHAVVSRTSRTQSQQEDSLLTCSRNDNRATHTHAMKEPSSPKKDARRPRISIESDPSMASPQKGIGTPKNKRWNEKVHAAKMITDQCRIPRKNPNHSYLTTITQTQTARRNFTERSQSAPPRNRQMTNTRNPTDLANRVVNHKSGSLSFPKVNSGSNKKKSKGTKIKPGTSLNSISSWLKELENDEIESFDDDTSTVKKRMTNGRSTYGKHTRKPEVERHSIMSDLTSWRKDENNSNKSSSRADRASATRSLGVSPSTFHGKNNLAPMVQTKQKVDTRRKSPKIRGRSNSIIEIDLSDSDDDRHSSSSRGSHGQDLLTQEAELQLTNKQRLELQKMKSLEEDMLNKRSFGARFQLGIVRIAIGSQLFSSGCSLSLQPSTQQPFFILEYKKTADTVVEHKISIVDASIEGMRYFIADEAEEGEPSEEDNIPIKEVTSQETLSETDDQPMSFLAMKVKPDDYNELGKYQGYYKDVQNNSNGKEYLATHFIVLESRSNPEFVAILKTMRNNEFLAAFLQEESRVDKSQVSKYTKAFVEDTEKDRMLRSSSLRYSTRSLRSGGKGTATPATTDDPEEVLLVYPFVSDSKALDESSLAFDKALGFDTCHSPTGNDKWVDTDSSDQQDQGISTKEIDGRLQDSTKTNGLGRTHYLSITREDYQRLEPGEFLNDTLIDFFMKWISRNDVGSESSNHFFTSHFYTSLSKDGIQGVASWTAKKNIDVFSKTLIFIPVNESLHWSLCVVVNPGFIRNALVEGDVEDFSLKDELPCILFMDSLKSHRKAKVAKDVRRWLNYEWKRLKSSNDSPFSPTTLRVFDPRIPYQDNSWDCGVFVCRYAAALQARRKDLFTFQDKSENFKNSVTRHPLFNFTMDDIAQLRQEVAALIDRLSILYKRQKEKEAEEKRLIKAARKKLLVAQEEEGK